MFSMERKTKGSVWTCQRALPQNGRKTRNRGERLWVAHQSASKNNETRSEYPTRIQYEGRKASCLAMAILEIEAGTCNKWRYVPGRSKWSIGPGFGTWADYVCEKSIRCKKGQWA